MRKTILAATLAVIALPATPALAGPGYDQWGNDGCGEHSGYFQQVRHRERNYYRTDNGISYWRGDNGRYYCRRPNGTTGMLIGGVAGALIGRSIDTRGDRAVGTILGAAGGALLGREVERSSARCR